jgi:hypothetical protein
VVQLPVLLSGQNKGDLCRRGGVWTWGGVKAISEHVFPSVTLYKLINTLSHDASRFNVQTQKREAFIKKKL